MPNTITPQIVNLNVKVTQAPTASQLQQSGALVSVGGTTLAANAYQFCGSLSAVEALLSSAGNFIELTNMATTFFAQGTQIGVYVLELGANAVVVDQAAALQTWLTNNPGVFYAFLTPADWDLDAVNVGSVLMTSGGSGYTTAPAVTFSAPTGLNGIQATGTANISGGAVTSVTITNPGAYPDQAAPTVTFAAPTSGTTATGTASMVNTLNTLAGDYANDTAKTYFFGTTTSSSISQYTTNKSMFCFANSPTAPSTEFSCAFPFYQWLVNNPGAANPLAPMQYRFGYGVTPWPSTGYTTEINTILTAYGNLITTGSQGGITTAILQKGTFMSADQMSWWYGLDWFEINSQLDLANELINGANSNPPLIYNQHGINTLQSLANEIVDTAVSFNCLLSGSVSATSFYTYSQQNPSDYKAGIYNGLLATVVGINGFTTITFNIDALQFAA